MRVSSTALALCLMAVLGNTHAADNRIAKWTDSDGVIHFSDTQFAPPTATEVNVAPANGMAAPAAQASSSPGGGPVWTVIGAAQKQNRIGWRSKGDGPKNGPIKH